MQYFILIATVFIGALVNGALGFGLSSITTPVGLIFFSPRLLNPALILNEVIANIAVFWNNRGSFKKVRPHISHVSLWILPGIVLGSLLVSKVEPNVIRASLYCILFILIVPQLFGRFGGIDLSKRFNSGVAGFVIGLVYSLTTVSGPLLSLIFGKKNGEHSDFRCSLAFVRIWESLGSALMYWWLGLINLESLRFAAMIVPVVAVGLRLGHYLATKIEVTKLPSIVVRLNLALVTIGSMSAATKLDLLSQQSANVTALLVVAVVTSSSLVSWRRPASLSLDIARR